LTPNNPQGGVFHLTSPADSKNFPAPGYSYPSAAVIYENTDALAANNEPRKFRQQRSSEADESDHEYYNEIDRLKCEMRPLQPQNGQHRNETTV
jgi:hypothetical protein